MDMAMEEIKSSTRMLLLSAVIMLVILLTGPLGYRFGVVPLEPSMISLLVAVLGSVLVLIGTIVYSFIASKNKLLKDRNILLLSMGISLLPIIIMGPQMVGTGSVPPIHDITTDTETPPEFKEILKHRAHAMNDAAYGSEQLPAEELAAMQLAAYPGVVPLETELTVDEAVSRAEQVLRDQGLEIIAVESGTGLVEATATTFWFGFKDDLVVRVTASEKGSRVDVRSVSRVGHSDVGLNAKRIEKFLAAF
jgi:uncharacterized protein (DUF1499 family)|tara:strand:+ start:183 stop:932 length:750 start_codon:yes stop_codon:yes gene_type:complete